MSSLPGHGRDCDCVGCVDYRERQYRMRLHSGETVGGLRATVESQRLDIERLRAELESARRELATYRPSMRLGQPPAPRYDGHLWSTVHSWTGPYHLVPVTWQPYPASNAEVELPDIWVPAKRALCGEPYHGVAPLWPAATEVCPVCVAKATPAVG